MLYSCYSGVCVDVLSFQSFVRDKSIDWECVGWTFCECIKEIAHLTLSSFTPLPVIPNLYDFLSVVKHKRRYQAGCSDTHPPKMHHVHHRFSHPGSS